MTNTTRTLADDAAALRELLEELETTIGAMSENDVAMEQVGEAFGLAEKLATALAALPERARVAAEGAA